MYERCLFKQCRLGTLFSKGVVWVLLVAFLMSSCAESGSSMQESTSSQDVVTELEFEPKPNALTGEFDQALSQIQDQKSADKAVDMFVSYMAEKFEEPASLEVQSGDDVSTKSFLADIMNVSAIADMEWVARSQGLAVQSSGVPVGMRISDFAAQLNETQDSIEVSEKELVTIRDGLRRLIPHLASDPKSELVSPLEAMVISWAYFTGDDGTMLPGKLGELKREDVLALKEKGLEAQIVWGAVVFIAVTVVTVVCGMHMAIMDTYNKDIFGNVVRHDEETSFCWKEKRGRRTVTRRGKRVKTTHYYTMDDLDTGLSALSSAVQVRSYANAAGQVALPGRIDDGLSVASVSVGGKGIEFPWEQFKHLLRQGDFVFMRNNKAISMLRHISYWTHVAMIADTSGSGTVIESWPKGGVGRYIFGENWGKQRQFSVRRLQSVTQDHMAAIVQKAMNNFNRVRYFYERKRTELATKANTLFNLAPWFDKYSTSSMYCSKLLWHVFKGEKNIYGEELNLDSNVTLLSKTLVADISHSLVNKYIEADVDDYGFRVEEAFVGVTPDDIYASRHLGSDIVLIGKP